MKVLVCGSRSWDDDITIYERIRDLPYGSEIIHGGARGADQMAAWAAEDFGVQQLVFFPDWKAHGRRAGIIRNLAMLDEQPDLVIAFWDGTSPGTKHTITEAAKRGIPVEVIPP